VSNKNGGAAGQGAHFFIMTVPTKAIRKNGNDNKNAKAEPTPEIARILAKAERKDIPTDKIEFSPLNYRKYIAEEELQQFAQEIAQHGIISPVLLRLLPNNRYELVVGERRLRGARIAKLRTMPAMIAQLTDDQVVEIQLAENLQRENPHPMHDAHAIGQMQKTGKTIDEIAARLGKTKQFVYGRIKLLSLTDAFQEMVLADAVSLRDALQVAALSELEEGKGIPVAQYRLLSQPLSL
jgi:ParB/RepB/Spo0J family partition protein